MDLLLRPGSVIQEIVSIVETHLEDFLQGGEEIASLEELEEKGLALLRRIGPVLLAWQARVVDQKIRPTGCPCGGVSYSLGPRPRALETRVGPVRLKRGYYKCRDCGRCWHPLDEVWKVLPGCLSPGGRRAAVELATGTTFREAQLLLQQGAGILVSLSTVWRATQRAGAERVQALLDGLAETSDRTGAAAFLRSMRGPGRAGRWAMAVDGLFLRIAHQYREVKIAVVGQLTETGEWRKGETTYLATTQPAETFRKLLRRHAQARGITWKSSLILLSDGAQWIAALSTRFFPNALHILDFWHASEYLFQAAHALYGEGTAEAQAFGEEMKEWMRKRTVPEILNRLEQERTRLGIVHGERQEALRKVTQYLREHAPCMNYEHYREHRYPIGSGPAEAGCKTLVQSRMKRAGMNWSPTGAENMLALRAEYYSRLVASPPQRC